MVSFLVAISRLIRTETLNVAHTSLWGAPMYQKVGRVLDLLYEANEHCLSIE